MEDNLNIIPVVFSIFLLIRLISSYIMKISLLACLILEKAMKMTSQLVFGRRPQHNFNCFPIFLLVKLIQGNIPKISLLACLILEIAVKKTLQLFEDCFGKSECCILCKQHQQLYESLCCHYLRKHWLQKHQQHLQHV